MPSTDLQALANLNLLRKLLDLAFIQHISTPIHIHGHILDVLCTSKSLIPSVCYYVKDGISDHQAVFFTTPFPVRNSCRVKCPKVKKLVKINICEFISDIANSELIQAAYKTAIVYYYSNIFKHLGIYLKSTTST